MPISTHLGRAAVAVAVAATVSACSSGPQMSAQEESGRYRSYAGGNYTPPGPASDPWGPYITEASAKFDVPERWIREVMRQESGGKLFGRGGQTRPGAMLRRSGRALAAPAPTARARASNTP